MFCRSFGAFVRSLSLAACVAPAMATGTELPLPDGLRALVRSAVADHPEVRAAQARVRAAEARRDGAARPLYNPELQLDAQRTSTGSNSLEAGLSQALDWHGKQAARTVGSEHELALARAGLVTVRARLAGELLAALRRCEEERAQRDLVQAQHDLLARFTRLTERRARAGDVPPAAVRLARLAVRQMALELASSEAAAGVQVLGAGGCPEPGLFPALPPDLPKALAEGLDERHPELQELAVAVTAAQAQIRQADTERRADPSLGLRLGRDAGENLVGLSFALPLQVRNDYRETVRAARAAHAEALAGLAAARQRLEATLDGSVRRLHRLHRAWEEWMAGSGASGSFDRDGELERLWRAGELDTGDYLQQLQQALDTRAAAESLRAALWTAWLDTWAASGLLSRWIEEE